MSRYFALPVLAVVAALVVIRVMGGSPAPVEPPFSPIVVLPQQDPEPSPAAVPQDPVPSPAPPPSTPPPAAPAPIVIVLDPLPPTPVVKTEVIERTVVVPQQPPTVIYAPTTIYAPVIEQPPPQPPPQEVVETPVIVVTNPGHGHPLPPARRPKAQQDSFFKEIPFLPPTPKGPRWNP
jgi:hypothetical protein